MSFELVGIRLTAQDYSQYMTQVASADKATSGFGDTSKGVFSQLPGLSDIAVGALHKVGAIAVEAFTAAGKAAIGFVTDSIGAAGDFEAGMNQFSAVAGGALDEAGLKTKDFRDLFISLGKELPVSTADVQQAATEMIKGGIDPATVAAGGLKQNIQFAAAAMGGDLAGAATVSAKILGGWADQGATAAEKAQLLTDATDLLTKAANASTVDVKELALGLYNVQGTAKTTGLSLEETTTALAELSPRFASSSEAGTSFKNFLVRLQPTTKPAIAAMEGLGLYTEEAGSKFFDANGKFIGVADASALLQDKLKGLTDAQKVQALQTIFGNDAMNTAAAFAEMGAQGFDDMAASMAKANGVQANAQTMQQGYNVALDNFHGSIEALQITIGSAFLPILTTLFNDVLSPAINTVTDLSAALSGDDDAFAKLSPTMQSIVTTIGNLMSGTGGLSSLWSDTLQPALRTAGAYFQENIMPVLNDLATALFPLVGAALNILAGLWNDVLLPALKLAWDAFNTLILPVIKDVAAWLAVNLPPAIKTVSDFFTGTLFPALHDIYTFIDTNVIPILKTIVDWLRDNIPPAIQKLADFWTTVLWPALQKVWQFISANVIPIFTTVLAWLRDNIPPAIQKLADFWNTVLWPALSKIWDFISTKIIPLFAALVNVNIAILQLAIKKLAEFWSDTLYPAIEKVYNWFNDNIMPIFKQAGDGAGVLAGIIKETLGPAFTWLNDNVLAPVAGWFGTISDKIQSLIGWLNDLAEKIRNLPSLPSAFTGHSPPPIANWMGAIADQTSRAAMSMQATGNAMRGLPASPMALMAAGNTTNATYNQQRNVNLNYHTTVAPPASTSLAIANALAY